MNKTFFITGLPRSRTAWFAAFMTASGYPCFHEAIDGCNSVEEYKDKISNCSDSTTAFCAVNVPFTRPTLIVHRNNRHGSEFDIFSDNLTNLTGLHIDFDDIDSRMSEIFTYLTGDKLNTQIYALFKNLRIETKVTYDTVSIHNLFSGIGV